MPTIQRLFQSPFRSGNHKRKNGRLGRPSVKPNASKSTSSPTTNLTESFNGENNLHKRQNNDDDLKPTVMVTSSTDSSTSNDDSKNDDSRESQESTAEDEDVKTAVIPSKTAERNRQEDPVQNDVTHTPCSKARNHSNEDDDGTNNESPINSVVFEKQIDTGLQHSCIADKAISPLLSSCAGAEEGFSFDDHRSTVSQLTEATNFRGAHRTVPPSPTHSTTSVVNKKMEDFLKTETEAIRQLLTDVDSGDEDSTVVEDSIRGANEAERMAREMEREMELLVKGKNDPEASSEDPSDAIGNQESPGSDVFLTDFRSVMHPSPESSICHQGDKDDESLISSLSRTSPTSPRRDLFQKRSSLYRLRQEKKRRKKLNKMKLRKVTRYFLRTLLFTLLLSSTVFVANWKWNFPNQNFSNAARGTRAQLKKKMTIDQERLEEIKAFAFNIAKNTKFQIGSRIQILASTLDGTKNRVALNIRETSSYLVDEAKYYAPLVAEQTKNQVIHSVRATNDLALSVRSIMWNSERLEAASQYARDRLEYAFTDREARERREEEERRLQKLLEAAAEAAAKEAAEQRQQVWTQTMFAGACAFVGSVATNYIWSAL
mmetsp:Transcript_13107/g.33045  ORF Transcript_13107/g.33045 Transcript_13107/m.33045 type:complete len:602 (+) Transcript_13107:182-1987(+)